MRGQLQFDAVEQDGCTLAAVHVTFLTQGCTLSKDHHCRNAYDPLPHNISFTDGALRSALATRI